ncbi:disintegrin and metalloproteinase domain-containing protein 29-like [Eptesicus fuscus]|uniref:disintegrin and metalloproteinase domain-containing protein 29-like n=1 Tax=Eptesicus fuscus TaxID=29078 RepID=UPI00240402BD|nr:disintegrin and metalloproteinase domain-containing protein 29-like [Eptesicus fuscus]
MRLEGGPITLRTPILLFGLWVVLAPTQCSEGRPSWRYISSEVVIPRKELHHGKALLAAGWLSYSLRFGGQRHVLHMRRKRLFWPGQLVVMTQDDQGALQVDHPFFPLDCYYLGYLEDVPLSMVTVDTCYGGLEGIMKVDDLAYEIKPLKDSQRFEHIISQIVADTNATGPTSRLGYKAERHPLLSKVNTSAASRISSKLYSSHRGNLKACLMSSKSIYTLYRNVSENIKFLVYLGSLMDSMFRGLDIRYYISILVIFNKRDPTDMTNFYVPSGPFALNYRNNIYTPFRPYSGLMMLKDEPHELNFNPIRDSLCTPNSLVYVGHLYRHILLLAVIATQQVGRTIGVYMDTADCVCQRRTTCIMYRYPVLTDAFSNCSMAFLQNSYSADHAECLYLTGFVHANESLTVTRCGNSEVEDKEQCDCGSFKECYTNTCCKTDCSFTPGSVCDRERCCTNCIYTPAGTLCRPIQNICDLPEYCMGKETSCPMNFYLQDGTPCTEDGYCYHGNCTDRSMHCKEIFGEGALNAPNTCYYVNLQANRFGHCRITHVFNPTVCSTRNVLCGRLQCTNVTYLPHLQEHVAFHQSFRGNTWCFGLDTHRGTETTDAGFVRTGTPCRSKKFCDKGSCNSSIEAINYNCHPSKCNYRGVCNNQGNCHCHVGWDPPRCINPGAGGSVDSGPPPRRTRSVKTNPMSIVYLRVAFGRLLALIAALLFGVATNVRTVQTTTVTEVQVGK